MNLELNSNFTDRSLTRKLNKYITPQNNKSLNDLDSQHTKSSAYKICNENNITLSLISLTIQVNFRYAELR